MTKLLDQAMDRAQSLSPEAQDEIARRVLAHAGEDQDVIQLTAEEEASFAGSLAQAAHRQFATEEQVEATWAKHGLRNVAARIRGVTALPMQQPRLGRRTSDGRLRRITATPYSYHVSDEATATEVIVIAVGHAARDPATMPGGA